MHAIEIIRLSKTFADGRKALDDVALHVAPGEMVALIGASGSGKSTLLRHLSGLVAGDRGDVGAIRVHGKVIQQNGRVARDIRRLRGEIGFVFQQFNLVGRLSVLTNVLTGSLRRIPFWRSLAGAFPAHEREHAAEALERMGLGQRQLQRASTLSGGQQQRAAIARALVQRARVLLADEPIASLDPDSCKRVMDALRRVNLEDNITVLVSLHQVDYATAYCGRVIGLREGRVVYDGPSAGLTPEVLGRIYGGELEAASPAPAAVVPLHMHLPVPASHRAALAG